MGKTLTIRIDPAQDATLTARAKAQGVTRSTLVREFIDQGLEERPLGRSIGHLKGRLALPTPTGGWRRRLKERNWR
jgi:hypothetical protein